MRIKMIDSADADAHLGGGEEEGARLSTLPLPQTPRIIFHLGKGFHEISSGDNFQDNFPSGEQF